MGAPITHNQGEIHFSTASCPIGNCYRTALVFFFRFLSDCGPAIGQQSHFFPASCPIAALYRTALVFFFRFLSDWDLLSDSSRIPFPIPVRLGPAIGQLSYSFSDSCPIGTCYRTALAFFSRFLSDWACYRTALAFFFQFLSDWDLLSDSSHTFFPLPVRLRPSIRQLSHSFPASCPIGTCYRTAVTLFSRFLSDWGLLSDSSRILFPIPVRLGPAIGRLSYSFSDSCPIGTCYRTALAFFSRFLSDCGLLSDSSRILFPIPVRLGPAIGQQSHFFPASCPIAALYQTALAFFSRFLSDWDLLSDSSHTFFPLLVRLGLLSDSSRIPFPASCPIGTCYRTAVTLFSRFLSNCGPLSDCSRILFPLLVRLRPAIGQQSHFFPTSCPIGTCYRTALASSECDLTPSDRSGLRSLLKKHGGSVFPAMFFL